MEITRVRGFDDRLSLQQLIIFSPSLLPGRVPVDLYNTLPTLFSVISVIAKLHFERTFLVIAV